MTDFEIYSAPKESGSGQALPASNADKVRVFHDALKVTTPSRPTIISSGRLALRADLIQEEFAEWLDAHNTGDLVEVADALADLLYVVYGTAHEYGLPIDAIFAEVHRSNMTKFEHGEIPKRADGKALKPVGWEPPRIKEILDARTSSTGN